MTLNDLEWQFRVKICFGLGNWWVRVSGFRTKLFENLQSYPYNVCDKNVAQERNFWQYKVYTRGFSGEGASNESVVIENGDFSTGCSSKTLAAVSYAYGWAPGPHQLNPALYSFFYQMEIFSQNLIVSAERRVTANSTVT